MTSKTKVIRIVYRDNDLFEQFVPTIVEVLETRGYSVMTTVFAKDGSFRKLLETLESWKASEVRGHKIVSDKTCGMVLGNECGIKSDLDLDSIVSRVVYSSFLGVQQGEVHDCLYTSDMSEVKSMFQKVIRSLGEKIGPPSVVNIKPDFLCDHRPFFTEPRSISIQEAVTHVQSWVREIYPDCQFDRAETDQATWVVLDRHTQIGAQYEADSGRGHQLLYFNLPVENMILDLARIGFLPLESITSRTSELLQEVLPK